VKPAAALAALVVVVALAAAPSQATFEGKNGLLVYQRDVDGYEQLFTVRPDGTGVRQVTDFPDSDAVGAAWSPDGTRIAFVRVSNERGETQRVTTMNADGSGRHELDRKLRWAVAWLPGGRRLLVVQGLRFVTVNADGSGVRDAGIPGGLADSPCLLGDGKRVAFLRSRSLGDSSRRAIFVGRLGGGRGSIERITPWQRLADKIDCAPDGSRVLFSNSHLGSDRSSNVFTIRRDGAALRQLTRSTGGAENNLANSWSPDGKKIAFVSNRDGGYLLYTMDADGTDVRRITSREADQAAWGTHP
jgi:Tol biopolymer transport system component